MKGSASYTCRESGGGIHSKGIESESTWKMQSLFLDSQRLVWSPRRISSLSLGHPMLEDGFNSLPNEDPGI